MSLSEFKLLCAFCAFHGCTPQQEEELINAVTELSIADREAMYYGGHPMPGAVYPKLSENCGEMGGYQRY